jgi:hypothetical protein
MPAVLPQVCMYTDIIMEFLEAYAVFSPVLLQPLLRCFILQTQVAHAAFVRLLQPSMGLTYIISSACVCPLYTSAAGSLPCLAASC